MLDFDYGEQVNTLLMIEPAYEKAESSYHLKDAGQRRVEGQYDSAEGHYDNADNYQAEVDELFGQILLKCP